MGLDKQVTTNKKDFIHLTRPEVTGNLLLLPFSVYLKINVLMYSEFFRNPLYFKLYRDCILISKGTLFNVSI